MSVSAFKKFLTQKVELGEKYLVLPMSEAENLIYKVNNCTGCRLKKNRTNVVFGEGNLHSKLLLIGEAPGYNEDISGRPFVGEAGKILTDILAMLDINRRDIYITNLIKCRPPNNRDPRPDEIKACASFLEHQIKVIRPLVLVTLGRFAAQHLLKNNSSIHSIRGKVHQVEGCHFIPTLHPAYILRNPSAKKYLYEDLKVAIQFMKPPQTQSGK